MFWGLSNKMDAAFHKAGRLYRAVLHGGWRSHGCTVKSHGVGSLCGYQRRLVLKMLHLVLKVRFSLFPACVVGPECRSLMVLSGQQLVSAALANRGWPSCFLRGVIYLFVLESMCGAC